MLEGYNKTFHLTVCDKIAICIDMRLTKVRWGWRDWLCEEHKFVNCTISILSDLIWTAFRDFALVNLTDSVSHITQCTSFSGATGGCDTSLFQISDITWGPMMGNVASGTLASMQCSGAAPCPGIQFVNFDQIETTGSRKITCSHVVNPFGFNCTT